MTDVRSGKISRNEDSVPDSNQSDESMPMNIIASLSDNDVILENQSHIIFIDPVGRSGGLVLLWKTGFTCDLMEVGDNIFHVVVQFDPTKPKFLLNASKAWSIDVNGSPGFQFIQRLKPTRRSLSKYNREHFGNINQQVDNLQSQLEDLQKQPTSEAIHNGIVEVNANLSTWHKRRADFYQQKSRTIFLKEHDNNTKFFHARINRNKARNNIEATKYQGGNWIQNRDAIADHLASHFKNISTSCSPSIDEGLFLVLPTIDLRVFKQDFIKANGQWLGVIEEFCDLIFQCISTTSFSVMLNGSPCTEFHPTRGIRQGDPLSPYLFIMAMKFLSRHLTTTNEDKSIVGIKVPGANSPAINHLLFADDCLIFTQVTLTSVNNLKQLLQDFSSQSRQVINFDISSVYYSKSTNPSNTATLTQILGVSKMNAKDKYLGSPLILMHSKQESFKDIKDNFIHMLSGWSSSNITQASMLVMIKHGIEKGLKIVQNNCFMEVNNGKRTRIWQDRWIAGMNQPPTSSSPEHTSFTFVNELIEQNTNEWNTALLSKLFDVVTVSCITMIFLDVTQEDKLIWMPAKDGNFSVKSTYNMLSHGQNDTQVNGIPVLTSTWKALWNCKLAHRIKLFIWKCIRDIIQTRSRISIYNPKIENICGSCGRAEGTIEHLIFECRHTRAVWRSINVDIDVVNSKSVTVDQWCTNIGIIKFNIDASFCLVTNLSSTGLVYRDNEGHCGGIKGTFTTDCLSSEDAKCKEVREALLWAKALQLKRIQIEGDAKLVIQSINENCSYTHWKNMNIIKKIKHLRDGFDLCIFSYVNRRDNQVADAV
ncbi:uncharacterized protein LOC113315751 [Papaver somniferum]|uniref:uncharacterized protein LOC113315751 n=1 Tax=Papaver somniferum TaxID=3469 RepID=UPI000E6F8599|nr:uncharacterized protein LOC113315751 [Papaver somniferum]